MRSPGVRQKLESGSSAAEIGTATTATTTELGKPVDPKLVPASVAPPHAQLDKSVKLANCHIRPHKQSTPRRRTNVKQHHMKLIAILGINHFGHRQQLPYPELNRYSVELQPPFCPGLQMLNIRAGSLQSQSAPSNAGTKHLMQERF